MAAFAADRSMPRRASSTLGRPASLRAGTVRLGTDELVVLDRPAPDRALAAVASARGARFDGLRAVHACYAPEPSEESWLRGVLQALEPVAPRASWFARLHALDALDAHEDAGFLLPGKATVSDRGASVAILEAVGPECYRDLVRPTPPVQLLSHRLRSLPAPLERRVAGILDSRGVRDALLLFGGEIAGCAVGLGMLVAPGIRPPSRTVGLLRHVASHLNTARRLREWSREDRECSAADRAREVTTRAARWRSTAPFAIARLERAGAIDWGTPERGARLRSAFARGAYALLDHWETAGGHRTLVRRCDDAGDPAALRSVETAVLAHATQALSTARIGELLAIAPDTVGMHLASARARLRCASRRDVLELLIAGFG
jgi:DNA-binding CsgD family transcriptional regulator